MEILKIKEWLSTKGKQFDIVIDVNSPSIVAIRIKDGEKFRQNDSVFHRVANNKVDSVTICAFGEDCINVAVNKNKQKAYTVPINELVHHEQFVAEISNSIKKPLNKRSEVS